MNKPYEDKIAKLIDLRSMLTFLMAVNVVFLADYVVITGVKVDSPLVLLFSNLATMTFTYYFTRKLLEGGTKS